MEYYEEKPSLLFKIKNYLKECWRVLRVTKKPNGMEFKTIVKVSGLGIIAIGLIGFLIQMVKQLFF
ncbi:MAG: protein translocase SEC61 complex subunit gamma [Candidatus Woesearchaeota archaeon]|jgi:protein transport protein SEC61 subunit gamma-like protein|nr:protein translocase SEC61 complex subunit gamma [Candidatus Woesearchaeota archaeon]